MLNVFSMGLGANGRTYSLSLLSAMEMAVS